MPTTFNVNDNYAETLGEALKKSIDSILDRGKVEISEEGRESLEEPFWHGGLSRGETRNSHCDKGRGTEKWAHTTIYRLESGRYEWLAYIL